MIGNMTLEQALISGLVAVTGALTYFFRIIWDNSVECKKWRETNEPLIRLMAEKLGLAKGTLEAIDICPTPGCPYSGKLKPGTYSISDKENPNKTRP